MKLKKFIFVERSGKSKAIAISTAPTSKNVKDVQFINIYVICHINVKYISHIYEKGVVLKIKQIKTVFGLIGVTSACRIYAINT